MNYVERYCELYIECYEKSLEIVKTVNDFLHPNEYDIVRFNEKATINEKLDIIKKSLESTAFEKEMPFELFNILQMYFPNSEIFNVESNRPVYSSLLKQNFNKQLDTLDTSLKNKYLPFLKRVTIDRHPLKEEKKYSDEKVWEAILNDKKSVFFMNNTISDIIWATMDNSKLDLIDNFLKDVYRMDDITFNRYTKGLNSGFSTIIKKEKKDNVINADFSVFEQRFADIYGQDEAIQTIKKVLLRNITFYNAEDVKSDYISASKGPLATFMFYGPTGTGKTESAKVIAEFVYGDDKKLLILDMSTYKDPRVSSSALKGHPEGYMDSEKGTDFTRFLKTNKNGVIVLDEFEKAHPSVRELFMTMLDEGSFKDALGNIYDLSGYVFIATTNASDKLKTERKKIGFSTNTESDKEEQKKEKEKEIRKGLREIFTAPIMNRFNNLVYFDMIKYEDAKKICENLLYKLREKFSSKKIKGIIPKISIQNIDKVAEILLQQCDYEKDGVRSLKNVVNDVIGSQILSEILENDSKLIIVNALNGKLSVSSLKKRNA